MTYFQLKRFSQLLGEIAELPYDQRRILVRGDSDFVDAMFHSIVSVEGRKFKLFAGWDRMKDEGEDVYMMTLTDEYMSSTMEGVMILELLTSFIDIELKNRLMA